MSSRASRRHLAIATALAVTAALGAAPAAQAAPPPTNLEKAADTRTPVTIASETTESSTVTANPDGTFTLTASSSPQRVRQGNSWVPVDTTLVKKANGDLAPRATVTRLTLGGRGGTDLVRLTDGANALAFTWPTKLPKPTISGSTATYPGVLPDVDLKVTANPTGYSSILVVKNAQAAANPALQELDLGVTGTQVRIADTANGGAEATDVKTGRTVFRTDTSLMWDSTPAASASSPLEKPAADRVGAHVAKIKVGVRAGKQHLSLDRSLLTAKTTKYPVFVDPVWSGNPSQLNWARISSNGWNVYNSTSTSGSYSARIGLDDWPGGAGEKARTYYSMNTSGLHGAVVTAARLYVVERWAASCSSTTAAVYGAGPVAGWNDAGLNWGKQPTVSALSTANGGRIDCGKSTERTSPASLNFDVTSWIQRAANGKWNLANMMVQAQNENDKLSWKQLGFGGGATLSVTYNFRPKLLNGTGTPKISPAVADQGTFYTTSKTPTLSARAAELGPNGKPLENVRILYSLYKKTGTTWALLTQGFSGYSQYGGDWTTPTLEDGQYGWKATAQNASGFWAGPGDGLWTANQGFIVNTSAPPQPLIASTQFPPGEIIGAAYDTVGTFTLTLPDRQGKNYGVVGYLFSLDGDLANFNYAQNKGIAWTPGTVITPGAVYYAKADNSNGTGTVVTDGSTAVAFAPRSSNKHVLFAKTVNTAGTTSGEQTYRFIAGTTNPIYAYGNDLISGWTATNTDGTTTVVPPATTTSTTGSLIAQPSQAGYFFANGYQAMLSNRTTTKVAQGDAATFYFNLPRSGFWQIGANLTTGADYGNYSVVLDAGTAGATTLLPGFEAWSNPTATRYVDVGLVMNGTLPRNLAKGVHSLTLTLVGKHSSSTGYQAGIDVIRLAPTLGCAIDDTAGCLNNTGISTFTAGTLTTADADGSGWSLDSATLRAAGWTPGRTVTVDGAAIKLPDAYGNGQADNMLASGQLVTVPATAVNKGNAVVFAGFATMGAVAGATGRITYAAGTCRTGPTEDYTIGSVTDWAKGTAGTTILTMPFRNHRTVMQNADNTASLFAISVPLNCPGATVAAISVPTVSNGVIDGVPAMHLLGLGIRPLSATGATRWTGSWSTAQDTGAIKTTANVNATLNGQTIRVPVQLSIGNEAGGKVRVHLANSLGTAPVTFDAASIAIADPGGGGADAVEAPIRLTFGGSAAVTLPAGADAVSDPVTLDAPQQVTALVSVQVHGTAAALAGHRDARTPVYVSAADGADHTTAQAGTGFTATTIGIPFVAGVDVSTPAAAPAGSVVLYGDHTVDSGTGSLGDNLTTAYAGSQLTGFLVPAGILSQGSSTAQVPTTTGPVDRDVLARTGVRVALISAGTNDLLACTGTADACASATRDRLIALAGQLHAYSPDDAMNDAVNLPGPARRIKVYVATVPPFAGAHTAAQEAARKQLNAAINDANYPLLGSADDAIDFAAAVATGGDATAETVKAEDLTGGKPNAAYYQDLAQQYLNQALVTDGYPGDDSNPNNIKGDPIAQWKLNGSGADDGAGTGVDQTLHPATLHNVTDGPGHFGDTKSGHFDGSTSYAEAALAQNTARSFTFAAWVRLSDTSTDRTILSRTSTTGFGSLTLGYDAASNLWVAKMPAAPTGTPEWAAAYSDEGDRPQIGVWTHLTATYDTASQLLRLYVDGNPDGIDDTVTPFNDAAGATWIGRGSDWFAGDIADVRVWDHALTEVEATTVGGATPLVKWNFDDATGTKATDVSTYDHHGALNSGASWTSAGHTDWAVHIDGSGGAVTTAGPVLRTDQSFTVAAWVKLTNNAWNYSAVSQEGIHSAAFGLFYGMNCACWSFSTNQADVPLPTGGQAASPASAVTLNTWTHLAGVYNARDHTVKLYVNGTEAGTGTAPNGVYHATGPFVAGRSRYDDHPTDNWPGDIDEVRAYQGALSPTAIQNLASAGSA
ncbi:LamG-like jellyroll fold domain-containing protein [Paractinoplanes durhamensis]|nr:LamG-like jellyroll fold domain-containing protein [Actinoplanes durhamensis]